MMRFLDNDIKIEAFEIYEPIENIHKDQILKFSEIPAKISGNILNLSTEWAKKISELCNEYEAVSIINDRVDIACVSGADGVHLGQNDISPNDVEKITENQLLIGTSNALKEEIEISAKNKSTYIAIGSIFPTTTKTNTRPASLQLLRDAKMISSKPLVAIGGINQQNIESVIETGVDSVCIATAITLAKDPEKTTKSLSNYFNI